MTSTSTKQETNDICFKEKTQTTEQTTENEKNTSDQKIKEAIVQLSIEIYDLKNKLLKPQVITLRGLNNLPTEPGRDWKEQIYDLFYSARLPMFWIIDLQLDETTAEDNSSVCISFINYTIKEHVKNVLTHYLNNEYLNNIYIT